MSVLGKIDAKALANDVSVTQNDATVVTTGDFTDDTTADYIEPGDILSLDGVQYLVKSVTDANNLELHTVYAGSTGTVSAADAIRRTAPKIVAQYVVKGGDSNVGSLVFLDADEAELTENKVRGLNGPGWWIYKTYTDMSGNTRHKAECIAPLYVSAAVAGDYADNPAADATSVISISVQPTDQATDDAVGAVTFSVTAADAPDLGDIIYQWQSQTASGTRWTNVSGATSSSLALTGLTTSDSGRKYRVKLTSTAGAEEVISDVATLTVTAA
jgi:hypothetical protein